MMLPVGAVPALLLGSRAKALGLNQHTFPAGQVNPEYNGTPGTRFARREKLLPPTPMACVPEIVSGWPDCARVIPLNSQPPREWPAKPFWFRKNGRRYV